MAKRKIIRIDESLCTGCGECITACAEGALRLEGGKAKVISERFCDGLGACLSGCPTGALTVEEREAEEFDEEAVKEHLKAGETPPACPSSGPIVIPRGPETSVPEGRGIAQLSNWPIQWRLVPTKAPYFQKGHLLLASDCVAFAFANMHQDFIKGKATVIGCPKLDDIGPFTDKLASIIEQNEVQDITLVHMEVPCCRNMRRLVKSALSKSGRSIPVYTYVISRSGDIMEGEPPRTDTVAVEGG